MNISVIRYYQIKYLLFHSLLSSKGPLLILNIRYFYTSLEKININTFSNTFLWTIKNVLLLTTWRKSIAFDSGGQQQWHYFLVISNLNYLKKLVKVKFAKWSAMDFRTGKLGGQQWIFGPASKFFVQNFKNSWKCRAKGGQQWFFGPVNDIDLKMSRKFHTRNLCNKFEITKY